MTQKFGPLAAPEPWDLVAQGYAEEMPFVMLPFSRRAIELVNPASDAHVVDVACGPGTLTLEVASRVAAVEAIDFAASMIGCLEKTLAERKLGNVRAYVGDGQALPFVDAQFDAGFSMFGLMFFPDRPRGYAELLRVLKPGGRALISTWAPIEDSPLMSAMFGAIHQVDPNIPKPQRDPLGIENASVVQSELVTAGFRDVTVEAHTCAIPVTSNAEELWTRMTRSSAPLVMMRKRLGEDEWQRGSERALGFLEQYLREHTGPLATTALLASGVKPATGRL
ncbi:MAG: class I SAM-dependent methyltransferase [Polyangiaceae bacterium]